MVAKSNNHIVVGLTGQFGAGCTTVAEYLEETGFKYYSLSSILKNSLQTRLSALEYQKLEPWELRMMLQDEGDNYRKSDTKALAKIIYGHICKDGKENEDVVIESIRNPAEIDFFRSILPRFYLLSLDVSSDTRWSRKEEDYNGDWDRFKIDDLRDKGDDEPIHGQKTETCVYLSDIILDNETPLGYSQDWDKFFYKVQQYIGLMKSPGYRRPTYNELYIHQAYAISLKSSCTKRQVGALIVSDGASESTDPNATNEIESYVLTSGRNDVPFGERICAELGGRRNPNFCPRDDYEEKALRKMKFCPNCGVKLNLPAGPIRRFQCVKCGARLPRDFTAGKLLDLCRAVHAEEAAVLQAAKLGSSSLRGTTLFTTTFPCLLCCKSIINAGIKKIIYREPYPMDDSINMLRNCGILLEKYEGVNPWAFDKMFKPSIR